MFCHNRQADRRGRTTELPPEITPTLPGDEYLSELKFQMPSLPAVMVPPQISPMVPQF